MTDRQTDQQMFQVTKLVPTAAYAVLMILMRLIINISSCGMLCVSIDYGICCCLISGRSVASGLNGDFDAGSVDLPPPVILSVAESNLPPCSVNIPSYVQPSLTMNVHPTSHDVENLTSEFYIPPPSVLTASGYLGSHGSLPEVVADAPEMLRKVGMGSSQVIKKSFNQAVGKLSNRMKVPPPGRFLGDVLDSDWDSLSLRSGLSDDEDETSLLLHQLEGQLEQPAFDHRIPYSDDVSVAASDTREEDHDIVGEVYIHACTHTHNRFTALSILSGTTRVSQYQKKHSPTHTHRGHQIFLSASSIYYDPWRGIYVHKY